MKVLIAVDLQNDFTTGTLGNKECAAAAVNSAKLIREYIQNGDPVFATLDTHQENYLETREGSVLPVVHCVKGTKGHELDSVVAEALGSSYFPVEKNTFGSKDLPLVIADKTDVSKIEEFDIIGVCTDICVISNVMILKAAYPEVPVRVIADCCAGVSPESHENALSAMKVCQVRVDESY